MKSYRNRNSFSILVSAGLLKVRLSLLPQRYKRNPNAKKSQNISG